jgi:hypothetical protein
MPFPCIRSLSVEFAGSVFRPVFCFYPLNPVLPLSDLHFMHAFGHTHDATSQPRSPCHLVRPSFTGADCWYHHSVI